MSRHKGSSEDPSKALYLAPAAASSTTKAQRGLHHTQNRSQPLPSKQPLPVVFKWDLAARIAEGFRALPGGGSSRASTAGGGGVSAPQFIVPPLPADGNDAVAVWAPVGHHRSGSRGPPPMTLSNADVGESKLSRKKVGASSLRTIDSEMSERTSSPSESKYGQVLGRSKTYSELTSGLRSEAPSASEFTFNSRGSRPTGGSRGSVGSDLSYLYNQGHSVALQIQASFPTPPLGASEVHSKDGGGSGDGGDGGSQRLTNGMEGGAVALEGRSSAHLAASLRLSSSSRGGHHRSGRSSLQRSSSTGSRTSRLSRLRSVGRNEYLMGGAESGDVVAESAALRQSPHWPPSEQPGTHLVMTVLGGAAAGADNDEDSDLALSFATNFAAASTSKPSGGASDLCYDHVLREHQGASDGRGNGDDAVDLQLGGRCSSHDTRSKLRSWFASFDPKSSSSRPPSSYWRSDREAAEEAARLNPLLLLEDPAGVGGGLQGDILGGHLALGWEDGMESYSLPPAPRSI